MPPQQEMHAPLPSQETMQVPMPAPPPPQSSASQEPPPADYIREAIELYNTIDEQVAPSLSKKDCALHRSLSEIQLLAAIFIIFFVTSVLPVTTFADKYFALSKIPYGDSLAKALIACIAVFLCIKLMRAT
jgi:hypothetical protein